MPGTSRTMMRTTRALVAGMTAAAVLTACGLGSGQIGDVGELEAEAEVAAELDRLYAAAVEAGESEIVIYNAGLLIEDEHLWDVFSARYPEIDVTVANMFGAEFVGKIEQEFNSDNAIADVVLQGSSSVATQAGNGYWAEYEPAGAEAVVEAGRDPDLDGYCVAPFADAATIVYNTNVVSEAEAPQSWDDLLDPKWRGRIVLPQLDKPGTTSRTFGVLEEAGVIDDAWLERLVTQEPVGVAEATQVNGAVTAGQGDIGLSRQSYVSPDADRGAPLAQVFPIEGGSTLSAYFGCVVENGPNPNAARLMLSWLLTVEAQAGLAESWYYPLVPGQEVLGGMPPIEDVEIVTVPAVSEPELIASMTDKLSRLFG